MMKKIYELTDNWPLVMMIVTAFSFAASIIAICFDDPSPGAAYVIGFLNSVLIMTMLFYDDK